MAQMFPATVRADTKRAASELMASVGAAVRLPSDLIGLIVEYARQSDMERCIDVIRHVNGTNPTIKVEYDGIRELTRIRMALHKSDTSDTILIHISPQRFGVLSRLHGQWQTSDNSLGMIMELNDDEWQNLLGQTIKCTQCRDDVNRALVAMYAAAVRKLESQIAWCTII